MIKNRLFILSILFVFNSSTPVDAKIETSNMATCTNVFSNDWSYCDTLACTWVDVLLETTETCESEQEGCQLLAIDRYDRCQSGG